MKQKEDKTETLKKYKENNEENVTTLYSQREQVRNLNLKILDKTQCLIQIDEDILDTYEEMRKIRQRFRQNEINVWDLKNELDDSHYEYKNTQNEQIANTTSTIPTERLHQPVKQKVYI